MALTLEGVVKAVDAAGDCPLRELAAAVVDAALLEARGNSGIILAEVLHGLFETWAPLEAVGGDDLVRGFWAAAERADQAMLEPVEGTILTVVRASAEALARLRHGEPAALLAAAVEAAHQAVQATTEQLDTLRDAGVVDAAGLGFELCLRAFAETAAGRWPAGPAHGAGSPGSAAGAHGTGTVPRAHGTGAADGGAALFHGPAFEVQYLLACAERDAEELKRYLAGIGDSIAVARSDGLYRVHVHTDHAGPAIEEALRRGTVSRIQVTHLGGEQAPE